MTRLRGLLIFYGIRAHFPNSGASIMLCTKAFSSELKDISKKDGIVKVYLNALGNLDSDGDRIKLGAYAKTIQERGPAGSNRIKFLWMHEFWNPIGVPKELVEDPNGPGPEGGLLATVQLAKGVKQADEALILYETGVLNEHSVGIDILRRDEDDRANVLEVRLWEGSVVTWGANPLTPFVEMKGETQADRWKRINEKVTRLQKALREPLTDETAHSLELGLKILESEMLEIQKGIAEMLEREAQREALDNLVKAVSSTSPVGTEPPNGTRKATDAPKTEADIFEAILSGSLMA